MVFRLGAGGTIAGNTITDHVYTPARGIAEFAVGIALFNAEPNLNPHLTQNNVFARNQHNVQRQSTAAAFDSEKGLLHMGLHMGVGKAP